MFYRCLLTGAGVPSNLLPGSVQAGPPSLFTDPVQDPVPGPGWVRYPLSWLGGTLSGDILDPPPPPSQHRGIPHPWAGPGTGFWTGPGIGLGYSPPLPPRIGSTPTKTRGTLTPWPHHLTRTEVSFPVPTPGQDRTGIPLPTSARRESACYAMGGKPLAVRQEDFLVNRLKSRLLRLMSFLTSFGSLYTNKYVIVLSYSTYRNIEKVIPCDGNNRRFEFPAKHFGS